MMVKIAIPPVVQTLGFRFAAHGRECYLVGGSVRDTLFGLPPHDFDCATDAPPEETKAILEPLGGTIFEVGAKFGTIGWRPPDGPLVEITTYRSEQYPEDSRKPEVQWGTSLQEDVRRRDFTINALAADPISGELIDLVSGLAPVRRRALCAVGRPESRFSEDPLRMLRAARFKAQFNLIIATDVFYAMRNMRGELQRVSVERIATELTKLLVSPSPTLGLELLRRTELLQSILPQLTPLIGLAQTAHHHLDAWDHTLEVVRAAGNSPLLRWAALLHDVGKPETRTKDEQGHVHFYGHDEVGADMAEHILTGLHFDNGFVRQVSRLVRLHMRVTRYQSDWHKPALRRLVRDAGDLWYPLLNLSLADAAGHHPERREELRERIKECAARCGQLATVEQTATFDSPLDGYAIMDVLGQPQGPWIKEAKAYLSGLVLDGEIAAHDEAAAKERLLAWHASRLVPV